MLTVVEDLVSVHRIDDGWRAVAAAHAGEEGGEHHLGGAEATDAAEVRPRGR